jgi:hypothetical protein
LRALTAHVIEIRVLKDKGGLGCHAGESESDAALGTGSFTATCTCTYTAETSDSRATAVTSCRVGSGQSLPADVPDLGTSSEACWVEHVGESAAAQRSSRHVSHMGKGTVASEQRIAQAYWAQWYTKTHAPLRIMSII